jgi:Ca2+-transporting ATPase
MGVKGTTVAKEASDIVLLDDNFSTVVKAVKEGRRIFDNIRKFINYLLVSNFAEVSVLFLSVLFFTLDKPILLPVQILWINLLTDGLPALALGADPARRDIMLTPPRGKNEPIINKRLALLIGLMGIKKTAVLLLTFLIILPYGEELARTTLFTGFILYEFVRIASIRYQEKLTWLSNPWLLMALFISLLLQIVILYTPLSVFFHVTALGLFEWSVLLIGVIVGYVLAIIITKIVLKLKL